MNKWDVIAIQKENDYFSAEAAKVARYSTNKGVSEILNQENKATWVHEPGTLQPSSIVPSLGVE